MTRRIYVYISIIAITMLLVALFLLFPRDSGAFGKQSSHFVVSSELFQQTLNASQIEYRDDPKFMEAINNNVTVNQATIGENNIFCIAWVNFGFKSIVEIYGNMKPLGVFEAGEQIVSVSSIDLGDEMLFFEVNAYNGAGSSQVEVLHLYSLQPESVNLAWEFVPVSADWGIIYTAPYVIVAKQYGKAEIHVTEKDEEGNLFEEIYTWSEARREFTK